jgi:hypothetical protein
MDIALRAIGWTRRQLGLRIGHSPTTGAIDRWAADEAPIPAELATWLKRAAEWHQANPSPQLPPRRYGRR